MKKLMTFAAVLLSMMFAFGSTASAQTADTFKEAGVDSGYMRVFMNMDAAMSGTPVAGQPMGVVAGVIHFSDTTAIEEDFEGFTESFADGMFDGGDYELTKVDDLGDEAYEVTGTTMSDGDEMPATGVISLQDEYVFISVSMGSEDTALDTDIVQYMLDADPSDTEVDFVEDGTSTGGAFDMMPTADDIDGLEGMEPFADMDMLAEAAS